GTMAPQIQGMKRRKSMGLRLGCLGLLLLPVPFALLVVGLESLGLFASVPAHFVVAVILAAITTLPYTAIVLWFDRNEKEPFWLVLLAFLWGALVATSYSGLFNSGFQSLSLELVGHPQIAAQLTASFSAPFIEELTKGMALLGLLVIFREEVDNILDGIIYGALVGLGFAWFENITYYLKPYLTEPQPAGLGDMLQLWWIRGVVNGVTTHAMFTGLTGLGIGLIRAKRKGFARWLFLPLFLGLAMGCHFAWNTFAGLFFATAESEAVQLLVSLPLAVLVLQVPFLLLLLMVVLLVWGHENRMIHDSLADEDSSIASEAEIKNLVPARTRNWLLLKHLFRFGPRAWWRRRRVETHLIALAFTKWHHREDQLPWTADQDAEVLRLRAKIRALRRPLR
ncbi:MAG: PrsW family intramembrane metalloprotease, partial [Myxococcota bacterium]|nr:PrsW family intramembrane metalloprotease [Myxococcota bacterium]